MNATRKNVVKSFVLSLCFSFAILVSYLLYSFSAGAKFEDSPAGTGGIGMVAGGISESLVTVLLIATPALFLITFLWLQKRRSRG